MNIYLRELRAYRKSLIIWCVAVLLMVVSGMSKYSATASDPTAIKALFASMPKSLMAIFGMTGLDVGTAIGYYGIVYLLLLVMLGIQASMLGARIFSKEEQDKTAEFLIPKPVSRNKIITSKLLASTTVILIINIVTLVSSIGIIKAYEKKIDYNGDIIRLTVSLLIFQLIYLFLGAMIAAISHRPKTSASIASGILLFGYILYIMIDLVSKIDFLKYITPFKYFEAHTIIDNKSIDFVYIIISVVLIIAFIFTTYINYNKRDMKI